MSITAPPHHSVGRGMHSDQLPGHHLFLPPEPTVGAAGEIAHAVVNIASPYGTLAVLSAIFLAVALLTNLLSNAATAILFSPIALSAAAELKVDTPFSHGESSRC